MSILYFALAPLFLLTIYKRVAGTLNAVKQKKNDKIKVELFFLGLTLVVSTGMFFIINSLTK
jgi:hypothetical protein